MRRKDHSVLIMTLRWDKELGLISWQWLSLQRALCKCSLIPQSDYYREAECTKFLVDIPVEWDDLVTLDSKIGDYVAMARRNGNSWYVAAVTDWTSREMKLELSFLPKGKKYKMEVFRDGINADIRAIDYKHEFIEVEGGEILNVSLASGGGWIAKISDY